MNMPVSLSPSLKPYRISSPFGVRREYPKGSGKWTPPHNGADWATPVGLPLVSGIHGKVTLRGGGNSHIWGNFIHIMCDCPQRHTQEFHILRELPSWLAEGSRVKPGDIVGYTGRSGSLNGKPYDPHHHQGATVNGNHYNPLIIGWPSGADWSSTPIENEDDMTPEQERKLNETHKMTAEIHTIVNQIHSGIFTEQPTSRGNPDGGVLVSLREVQRVVNSVYDGTFTENETSRGTPGGTLKSLAEVLDRLPAKE